MGVAFQETRNVTSRSCGRITDITYISLREGFLNLAAVMDWFSLCAIAHAVRTAEGDLTYATVAGAYRNLRPVRGFCSRASAGEPNKTSRLPRYSWQAPSLVDVNSKRRPFRRQQFGSEFAACAPRSMVLVAILPREVPCVFSTETVTNRVNCARETVYSTGKRE